MFVTPRIWYLECNMVLMTLKDNKVEGQGQGDPAIALDRLAKDTVSHSRRKWFHMRIIRTEISPDLARGAETGRVAICLAKGVYQRRVSRSIPYV